MLRGRRTRGTAVQAPHRAGARRCKRERTVFNAYNERSTPARIYWAVQRKRWCERTNERVEGRGVRTAVRPAATVMHAGIRTVRHLRAGATAGGTTCSTTDGDERYQRWKNIHLPLHRCGVRTMQQYDTNVQQLPNGAVLLNGTAAGVRCTTTLLFTDEREFYRW